MTTAIYFSAQTSIFEHRWGWIIGQKPKLDDAVAPPHSTMTTQQCHHATIHPQLCTAHNERHQLAPNSTLHLKGYPGHKGEHLHNDPRIQQPTPRPQIANDDNHTDAAADTMHWNDQPNHPTQQHATPDYACPHNKPTHQQTTHNHPRFCDWHTSQIIQI